MLIINGVIQLGGGGGSGYVFITDITTATGDITSKVYEEGTLPEDQVLLSCNSNTYSITVHFIAEGGEDYTPVVESNSIICEDLALISESTRRYTGSIALTITGSSTISVRSDTGQLATCQIVYGAAPEITNAVFSSSYPGSQTELKENDTMQVTITADKEFNYIEIADYGACKSKTESGFEATTEKEISVVIDDKGTNPVFRPFKCKVRTAEGSYSEYAISTDFGDIEHVNKVNCNNQYPTFSNGSIVYPPSQQAIKDSEQATVSTTVTYFDEISYSSPNSQVSIASPNDYTIAKTAQRIAGNYNISTTNFRITATRNANAATATRDRVVYIAHVAPVITLTPPAARLRSGGNDGTSAQNHTITLSSSQNLIEAPTLNANIGTWQGAGFIGSGTTWTRSLQIHDNNTKGTGTFSGLVAENLAGIEQNTIGSGASYTVGGFVSRNITLAAYANEANMNVAAIDYSKVSMTWSIKALPNKRAVGTTETPDANSWCLHTLETNPTIIRILDTSATDASSSPSTITIQESI